MTPTERRAVDAACLRILGWTQKHWSHAAGTWSGVPPGETRRRDCSPSTDPALVVPLAEALRGRGYHVSIQSSLVMPEAWEVSLTPNDLVYKREGDEIPAEFGATIQEALALAAARAVGEEKPDNA